MIRVHASFHEAFAPPFGFGARGSALDPHAGKNDDLRGRGLRFAGWPDPAQWEFDNPIHGVMIKPGHG